MGTGIGEAAIIAAVTATTTAVMANQSRQDAKGKAAETKRNRDILLQKQERAAAERAANETETRRRRQSQAGKRMAIGLAQGKIGTTKTGSLGLQTPSSLAVNKVGGA